jgi:hypothetical protein
MRYRKKQGEWSALLAQSFALRPLLVSLVVGQCTPTGRRMRPHQKKWSPHPDRRRPRPKVCPRAAAQVAVDPNGRVSTASGAARYRSIPPVPVGELEGDAAPSPVRTATSSGIKVVIAPGDLPQSMGKRRELDEHPYQRR